MKRCSHDDCPIWKRTGERGEYSDDAERCSDCGTMLETIAEGGGLDRPVAQRRATPSSDTASRLFVTLLVGALFVGGLHLSAPGIDLEAFQVGPDSHFGLESFRAGTSVLAIGAEPFFTAAALVELVAVIVPRWRRRRISGPAARRPLAVASVVLGLLLAGMQSYAISGGMASLGTSTNAPLTAVVMLVGSIVLLPLAHLVTSRGLVGGLGLFLVLGLVVRTLEGNLPAWRGAATGGLAVQTVAIHLAIVAACAYLTVRALRSAWSPRPRGGEAESGYRAAPGAGREDPAVTSVPVPASGLLPLTLGLGLVGLFATFRALGVESLGVPVPDIASDGWWTSAFALSLTVPIAWVFQPASRIEAIFRRAFSIEARQPVSSGFRSALLKTLAYFAALLVLERISAAATGSFVDLTVVAGATAMFLDAAGEWRLRSSGDSLASVAEEHRPYAAGALLQRLQAEGIGAAARGLHLRTMLQFFAPYVPIAIFVPVADAPRARSIAREVLGLATDQESSGTDSLG
jgi:hypothetical protein